MMSFGNQGVVVEYDSLTGRGWLQPDQSGTAKIPFTYEAQPGENVLGRQVFFTPARPRPGQPPRDASIMLLAESEPTPNPEPVAPPASTSVVATTPTPTEKSQTPATNSLRLRRLRKMVDNTQFMQSYTRDKANFVDYVAGRQQGQDIIEEYAYDLSGHYRDGSGNIQGRVNLVAKPNPPLDANPGLLLDKYIGFEWEKRQDVPGQKYWLKGAFVPHYHNTTHTNEYQYAFEYYRARWESLVEHYQPAQSDLKVAWRLAMHLGRESVLENATVALQRSFGFPLLPGQSLKGIAHAYAEYLLRVAIGLVTTETEERQEVLVKWKSDLFEGCDSEQNNWLPALERVKKLFGSLVLAEDKDLKKQITAKANPAQIEAIEKLLKSELEQGRLIFFDAIPVAAPDAKQKWLKLDVLTPHFGDWYSGKTPVPSDNQNPVPVQFLTVPAPTKFSFAVGLVRREDDKKLTALGLKLLREGLTELGAGAKTAAGYGQLIEA